MPDSLGEKSLNAAFGARHKDHVVDVRKQSLFRMVDTDNNGTIDEGEFGKLYDIVRDQTEKDVMDKVAAEKQSAQSKRRVKLFGCASITLLSFLLLSVASTSAMMFYLLDVTKETRASDSGVLALKKSNKIVQTAQAKVNLPLVVSPLLTMKQLAEVQFLTVERQVARNATDDYDEDELPDTFVSGLEVVGFQWFNKLEVIFETRQGMVVISNGEIELQKPDGAVEPLCHSSVECGAVEVNAQLADALLDEAAYLLGDPSLNTTTEKVSYEAVEETPAGYEESRRMLREQDGIPVSLPSWRHELRQLGHSRCSRSLEDMHPSDQLALFAQDRQGDRPGRRLARRGLNKYSCCLKWAAGVGGKVACCKRIYKGR